MANIIKGTKETIGMAPSRPIRRAVQSWLKALVTTPKAARMENTFITTALSGTNSERKASRRKNKESTSTIPYHQGQLVRDLARLGDDVVSQSIYEVLGRTRGGRGGCCHGIDRGVALLVDQRQGYLVYALGLLKVRAQGGEPRVVGLGFEELLLVLLP